LTKKDENLANQISSDNFLANPAVKQQKPDMNPGALRTTGQAPERHGPSSADRAEIGPARQLLSQESRDTGETAIAGANEARRQAALLKEQLSGSPAAAVKAHGAMDGNIFKAAMARPAV